MFRTLCVIPLQLLGCIGEQFDDGDEICGVVVNVRTRGDRICLWTRTASNEAVQVGVAVMLSFRCMYLHTQVNIGKQLRRMLDMEDSKIGYIAHVRGTGSQCCIVVVV